jgi:hypothetical protein
LWPEKFDIIERTLIQNIYEIFVLGVKQTYMYNQSTNWFALCYSVDVTIYIFVCMCPNWYALSYSFGVTL